MQVHLYFHSGEPLKNLRGTKDHIATIFNLFMPGGNKRACILKQTCIFATLFFLLVQQNCFVEQTKQTELHVCLSVYDVLVIPGVKMS